MRAKFKLQDEILLEIKGRFFLVLNTENTYPPLYLTDLMSSQNKKWREI